MGLRQGVASYWIFKEGKSRHKKTLTGKAKSAFMR
jgi:hypothetical protein